MHSFYPSRGRIFFEVLCAFAVVTSCVGAWRQTGASALLIAAGVAALYGLVHLFDMRRPKSAEASEPQRIDFEPETADIVVPMIATEYQPTVDEIVEEAEVVEEPEVVEEAEVVEAAAARAGSGRRSGGSRKASGRRAKTPKAAKIAELAPAEDGEFPRPMADEAKALELVPSPEEEFTFVPEGEAAHPTIEPLFEPEPFARMPRRAFGRRGQI
jgi:hypothetical protein